MKKLFPFLESERHISKETKTVVACRLAVAAPPAVVVVVVVVVVGGGGGGGAVVDGRLGRDNNTGKMLVKTNSKPTSLVIEKLETSYNRCAQRL